MASAALLVTIVGMAFVVPMVLTIDPYYQRLNESLLPPGSASHVLGTDHLGRDVLLRVEETDTPFTCELAKGQIINAPIAHGEGNYFADDATLDELERNRQVIFRYCDDEGRLTGDANPNGSARSIAGICNRGRNVLGMMPHPERACEGLLGSNDGRNIFRSLTKAIAAHG